MFDAIWDILFGFQFGGWKATLQMIVWFTIIYTVLLIWYKKGK